MNHDGEFPVSNRALRATFAVHLFAGYFRVFDKTAGEYLPEKYCTPEAADAGLLDFVHERFLKGTVRPESSAQTTQLNEVIQWTDELKQ